MVVVVMMLSVVIGTVHCVLRDVSVRHNTIDLGVS